MEISAQYKLYSGRLENYAIVAALPEAMAGWLRPHEGRDSGMLICEDYHDNCVDWVRGLRISLTYILYEYTRCMCIA